MTRKNTGSRNRKSETVPAASEEPANRFPVVGIGASAGGLAAFEAFFSGMSGQTDTGMAFLLVNHHGDILDKHGRTGMFLEPAPGETKVSNRVLAPHDTRRTTKCGDVLNVRVIATALINEAGQLYAIATTERLIT